MSTTPDPNHNPVQPSQPIGDGYTGLPKWVKWTLLAILAVAVILVVVRLVGGGNHGPGRHGMVVNAGSAPAAVTVELFDR